MSIQPVFIFSLPRSGSTLVQRVLAAHPEVASAAEPWFLLPLMYSLREEGASADYGHGLAARAVNDFALSLPGGKRDYASAIRQFAMQLYSRSGGPAVRYFVDKTPRYHLVIRELLDTFPDAKCVLIWRNPLAVAASILTTWGERGRWNLYRYNVDLYKGLENLCAAGQELGNRFFTFRYEEAVAEDSVIWEQLFRYLELSYDSHLLNSFASVRFSGRMGDPTGPAKYQVISAASINDWAGSFSSILRRAWARRYLAWIGDERLSLMGYDRSQLLTVLDRGERTARARFASDAVLMGLGALHAPFDLSGIKRQIRPVLHGRRSYALT
ncbi:MAG TPA: sulfotransferase [Gemmatimonadaceae bacterium]|nr:sulfotransferase [Gemmatimonadaceae bacterium]